MKQYNQAAKLKHKSLSSRMDTITTSNRKQQITIAQKTIGKAEEGAIARTIDSISKLTV